MNLKLTDNGPVNKISHIFDIENIFGDDNLHEYVHNSSFQFFRFAFVLNVDNINFVIAVFWIKLDLTHLI